MNRPLPINGESKRGYVLRLCEENRLKGFSELSKLLGKSQSWCVDTLSKEELCGLVGATEKELEGLTLWIRGKPSDLYYEYHGRVLHTSVPQKYFYRYCPLCLEEEAFVRDQWHINHAPVCLRHSVLMNDRCAVCRKAQSWDRLSIVRCEHCDHSLLDTPVICAGEHVINMQKFILSKMQSAKVPSEEVEAHPAFKWLEHRDTDRMLKQMYLAYMDAVFGGELRWSYVISPSVESSYEMLAFWHYSLLVSPRFLTRALGQFRRPLEQDVVDAVRGRKYVEPFDWLKDWDPVPPVKNAPDELERYEEHFDAALPARLVQR